ncbi:MAG: ion channel [Boseongicola sp.]
MKSGNFAWLLLALIVFLVGIPIADEFNVIGQPLVRAVAFSALLGIGVLSLKGSGRPFTLAMVLVVAGVSANIAASHTQSFWLIYTSLIFIMGFLLTAVFFTFKQVATDTEISTNRIIGAIAVYLLMGVLWAVGYTIVELTWPGSIKGFEVGGNAQWNSEWLYFSFVTMTTLGYGDIAPVSAIARSLAYMQAVFGQFYIAILVAGLVGAYISRQHRGR